MDAAAFGWAAAAKSRSKAAHAEDKSKKRAAKRAPKEAFCPSKADWCTGHNTAPQGAVDYRYFIRDRLSQALKTIREIRERPKEELKNKTLAVKHSDFVARTPPFKRRNVRMILRSKIILALTLTISFTTLTAFDFKANAQEDDAALEQVMSQVVLDETLLDDGNESVAAAWIGYALARLVWVRDNASSMENSSYRISFEEEVHGRESLVKIWEELKEKDPALKNIYLDEALKIYKAGYLSEYVWLYLWEDTWKESPPEARVKEFIAWQDSNLPNHQAETLAGLAFE